MIFNIILTLLFSCFSIAKTGPCSLKKSKIDMNKLRATLLHNDGYWEYLYSYAKLNNSQYSKDTCIVLEEGELKLPRTFLFKEGDTTGFKEKYPWYYKSNKKELYGLQVYNENYDKPSYPLVVNISRDSTGLLLNFYYLDNDYINKDLLLKKINRKTMVLQGNFLSKFSGRYIYEAHHVYVNKPAS